VVDLGFSHQWRFTRWFRYDRDLCGLLTHKSVPFIIEPPCILCHLTGVSEVPAVSIIRIEDSCCVIIQTTSVLSYMTAICILYILLQSCQPCPRVKIWMLLGTTVLTCHLLLQHGLLTNSNCGLSTPLYGGNTNCSSTPNCYVGCEMNVVRIVCVDVYRTWGQNVSGLVAR